MVIRSQIAQTECWSPLSFFFRFFPLPLHLPNQSREKIVGGFCKSVTSAANLRAWEDLGVDGRNCSENIEVRVGRRDGHRQVSAHTGLWGCTGSTYGPEAGGGSAAQEPIGRKNPKVR